MTTIKPIRNDKIRNIIMRWCVKAEKKEVKWIFARWPWRMSWNTIHNDYQCVEIASKWYNFHRISFWREKWAASYFHLTEFLIENQRAFPLCFADDLKIKKLWSIVDIKTCISKMNDNIMIARWWWEWWKKKEQQKSCEK